LVVLEDWVAVDERAVWVVPLVPSGLLVGGVEQADRVIARMEMIMIRRAADFLGMRASPFNRRGQ
jgi:hypothetical protein